MCCTTFGALCGQLGYVVPRLPHPWFIGLLALPTPHNILHADHSANVYSTFLVRSSRGSARNHPRITPEGSEHADSVVAKTGLSQDRDAKYYVVLKPQRPQ